MPQVTWNRGTELPWPSRQVAAALGPADHGKEPHAHARAARLASRRRRRRRRPRPTAAANRPRRGRTPRCPASPAARDRSESLTRIRRCSGRVDEEQSAERPERLAAEARLGLLVEQDHPAAGVGQLRRRDQARESTMTTTGQRRSGGRLNHPQEHGHPARRTASRGLARVRGADDDQDLEPGAEDGARGGGGWSVATRRRERRGKRGRRGERHRAASGGGAAQPPESSVPATLRIIGVTVRAAAVVLLVGVGRVGGVVGRLVGGDRLVLDAVVLGQLAGAQREHGGRQRARAPRRSRRRRRASAASWAPPSEAAAATPITAGLSNGSLVAGIVFLTSGITANASPSRTTPRTPGTPSTPRTLGFGRRRPGSRRACRARRPPSGSGRAPAGCRAGPYRRGEASGDRTHLDLPMIRGWLGNYPSREDRPRCHVVTWDPLAATGKNGNGRIKTTSSEL